MSQFRKLLRLFSISPGIAFSKVFDNYSKKLKYKKLKEKYLTKNTYSQYPFKPEQKLYSFYQFPDPSIRLRLTELKKKKDIIEKLAENYINHNFNLLGSGWKNIKLKDESTINSNQPNSSEQEKIKGLIDNSYHLIDWQIDFKSGFRWDENTWYKDIKFGYVPGADIKVPWELGRMQHLSVLAIAKIITNYELRPFDYAQGDMITNEKVNESNVLLKEFQNQILDFIASNPPGFGVQWSSSMDVAIRAVNWLVSFSLFKEANADFVQEFEYYFIKSIYEHGKHIIENLEWSSGMRGNHYLANIAGIIFIASYLPETDETNSWLIFAINELCNEILEQFNEDGSNFEASTNYHYFSAVIVFNTISLILTLPKEKLSVLKNQANSYYNFVTKNYSIQTGLWSNDDENNFILNDILRDRLNKIYEFSSAIISETGFIPQIGDNDSGQFLITNYELLIRDNLNQLSMMKNVLNLINKYQIDKSLTPGNLIKEFKDFGLYILENKGIRMFIRCGSVGQKGKGGHCHNDQLSYELFIDNKPVIVDPGTYVYTPYPEMRNEYRATRMHNTLWIEGYEQNDWDNDNPEDLFWIKNDKAKARLIEFSDEHFIGEHYGYPKPHKREIRVESQQSTVGSQKSIVGSQKSIVESQKSIVGSQKSIVESQKSTVGSRGSEVGSQKEEFTIHNSQFTINSPEVKIGKKESVNINVRGIDVCNLNKTKFISFHFAPNVVIKKLEKDKVIINFEGKIIELSCRDRTMFCQIKSERYFYSPGYGVRIEAEMLVIESRENKVEWQIEIKSE
ncbi:MAG: hypothetical protein A2X61_06075 [Ignavibacteria bacterium GWB2_35_12]|nr:MAG: hypothetical protein A2X63_13870 [Ignavibacteria bacterium GWA2_35_8]OGU39821.1 MAG: hypothetical protein A2X61_06075 [Ignavibacteria bacterium GWB2_35_12]OGU90019.1 MAG: hypothetical protein A2220_05235 [Ignavibacteria bacterium RIFOXYA2_FULL_35_10]OGV21451.1 MAG: hypothetical protein A2475_13655 [Ignavibacteria bacterium RIFOXYC2_FULL_35_21]